MEWKLEPCMVLETILLESHIKDFGYQAVNGIAWMKIERKITFKTVETLSLEKPNYYPNQGTVKESLVIRNVQIVLSQV